MVLSIGVQMKYISAVDLNTIDYKACAKGNGINYYENIKCVYCGGSGSFKPLTENFIRDIKKEYSEVRV